MSDRVHLLAEQIGRIGPALDEQSVVGLIPSLNAEVGLECAFKAHRRNDRSVWQRGSL